MRYEDYIITVTLPNGTNVMATFSTDDTGCGLTGNMFFAGSHIVVDLRRVEDNCVAEVNETIILTQPNPPAPFPAVGINPTVCSGTDGQIRLCDLDRYESYDIQITAPDGTVSIMSVKSNGDGCFWINNLSAGTYLLGLLTDNTSECSTTLNELVTLDDGSSITLSLSSSAVSFCSGQSATVTAMASGGSGSGYTYLWSNGETSPTVNLTSGGTFAVTVSDSNNCKATERVVATENIPQQVQIIGATQYCMGSSTDLRVGNYASYTWSDGSSQQSLIVSSPGTYAVTVVDVNGCSTTDQVTVTELPVPNLSIEGDLILCSEGDDETSLDAGTGFDSYLWSTGDTLQVLKTDTAGTYTVTVTNQFGCSKSDTVMVRVNSEMQISESVLRPSCDREDGRIDLNVNMGMAPYSYNWSNGSTSKTVVSLAGGTYTVTVTDAANCTQTKSFVIETIDSPTAFVASAPQLTCERNQITLDGTASSSGPNMTYTWSTMNGNIVSGSTSLTPVVDREGVYVLTVMNTANGCYAIGSAVVLEDYNTPSSLFSYTAVGGEVQFVDGSIGNPSE